MDDSSLPPIDRPLLTALVVPSRCSSSAPATCRDGRGPRLNPAEIHAFVSLLFADDLHAKRVLSLANGVVGVIHSASLAVHAVGEALAQARGLDPHHAVKQVDRLLSNRGVDVEDLFPLWVGYVLGRRQQAVVTLD